MFPVVSCTIGHMNEDHRKRLGDFVIGRRFALGMGTTKSLAEKAGLSPRMLGDVENGRRQNFSAGAKAQIERALDWAHGSIDDVLLGLEPTIIVATPPSKTPRRGGELRVDLTAIPGDALVEELRRRMMSDLDYLSSHPVRRWTGFIELVELDEQEEEDGHDVAATTESNASTEAQQAQEDSADKSQDVTAGLASEAVARVEAALGIPGDGFGHHQKEPGLK